MYKKKFVLIGIAGTDKDFLLSLPTLKSYLNQYNEIKDTIDIILKNYPESISVDKIVEDIKAISPDIVGLSCYIWNNMKIENICKELDKKITIILGGPEISKDDIIEGKYNADYIIFGEGEKPLYNLLTKKEPSKIKGLAFKKGNIFQCNTVSDTIEDLQTQCSPFLTNSIPKEIFSNPENRLNIETQRGCTFKCAYCLYHKNFPSIRYRNPDTVIKEIEYGFKKGMKIGRIVDANFFSNFAFAKKILRGLIKKKIKMRFHISIIPQFLNQEMIDVCNTYIDISDDNSILFDVGMQSLNEESLKIVERVCNIPSLNRSINLISKSKATATIDTILGLPRETKETYFQMLEYIIDKMKLGNIFINPFILKIIPNTKLTDIAKTEHLVIDRRDTQYNVYSTPTISREEMIYCQKMTTVVYRLFNVYKGNDTRTLFYEVKNKLNLKNTDLIEILVRKFSEFLQGTDSDFIKKDFPSAEDYYYKKVNSEIPDKWLKDTLNTHWGATH